MTPISVPKTSLWLWSPAQSDPEPYEERRKELKPPALLNTLNGLFLSFLFSSIPTRTVVFTLELESQEYRHIFHASLNRYMNYMCTVHVHSMTRTAEVSCVLFLVIHVLLLLFWFSFPPPILVHWLSCVWCIINDTFALFWVHRFVYIFQLFFSCVFIVCSCFWPFTFIPNINFFVKIC